MNEIKFVPVEVRKGKKIEVPDGGLAHYFLSRGWQIFDVVDSSSTKEKFSNVVDETLVSANRLGNNGIVVWRTLEDNQKVAYVLNRSNQKRKRRAK